MKLKVKDNCPLDNFNPCRKFECGWFIQIRGKHPQTGEEVDEYGNRWEPVKIRDFNSDW